MNLFCDAEQSSCIALVQEAAFMLKEWTILLLGWMNEQMSVVSACAPLGIVERDSHQIWKCRNKKNDAFFFFPQFFDRKT